MRRFVLFLSLAFLAGCSQSGIEIDPLDRTCLVDSDCTFVLTQCDQCECFGEPVNKDKALKYREKYEFVCDRYTGAVCDLICEQNVTAKCVNDVCVKVVN